MHVLVHTSFRYIPYSKTECLPGSRFAFGKASIRILLQKSLEPCPESHLSERWSWFGSSYNRSSLDQSPKKVCWNPKHWWRKPVLRLRIRDVYPKNSNKREGEKIMTYRSVPFFVAKNITSWNLFYFLTDKGKKRKKFGSVYEEF